MSDIADIAQVEIDRENERAVINNKNLLQDSGIIYCLDCEEKIPEARKKAMPSAKRCIECEDLKGRKHV